MHKRNEVARAAHLWVLSLGAALVLSACGGGGATEEPLAQTPDATSLSLDTATLPPEAATQIALPAFDVAPVLLGVPSGADAVDNIASSRMLAHTQSIPSDAQSLDTRRLTVQALEQAQRARALAGSRLLADGSVAPLAASGTVTTYTPAQIRAAYGLPALPSAGLTPTAAQAAQLGAGQTIYIVDAMHNPNVAAELTTFNQTFGLPACTTKPIAVSAALPLAAASVSEGCTLSVVYNTANGGMTSTAPAYDARWATEIALDVQWAHATAPLARIVLIESADATLDSLLGGVKLANAMGSGVVSMSFGSPESNWTASADPAFTVPGMTYLAATGDSGSAVAWPSVSANVLAVGGTSLAYGGTGLRSETGWSRTGGGISGYVAKPAYQSINVPGAGSLARRAVADVSFNADPLTGQYVAVLPVGNSVASWVSAGGTSIATPQWAGLIAIANALRAQAAKPPVGAPHAALYSQIATVPGTYAASFADVLVGSNGTCATCAAKVGYDVPTGLGTPNAAALLTTLTGLAPAPVAPVVNAASVSGRAGVALSFRVTSSAANPVTYAITNAPAGMTIASTGMVTWSKPVTGTFTVTATVKDTRTALSGQAAYTVQITNRR